MPDKWNLSTFVTRFTTEKLIELFIKADYELCELFWLEGIWERTFALASRLKAYSRPYPEWKKFINTSCCWFWSKYQVYCHLSNWPQYLVGETDWQVVSLQPSKVASSPPEPSWWKVITQYDFFEILLQDGNMVVQIGDFLDRVVDRETNTEIWMLIRWDSISTTYSSTSHTFRR